MLQVCIFLMHIHRGYPIELCTSCLVSSPLAIHVYMACGNIDLTELSFRFRCCSSSLVWLGLSHPAAELFLFAH